jgi:hypothetical protein
MLDEYHKKKRIIFPDKIDLSGLSISPPRPKNLSFDYIHRKEMMNTNVSGLPNEIKYHDDMNLSLQEVDVPNRFKL